MRKAEDYKPTVSESIRLGKRYGEQIDIPKKDLR